MKKLSNPVPIFLREAVCEKEIVESPCYESAASSLHGSAFYLAVKVLEIEVAPSERLKQRLIEYPAATFCFY